jgi:dihydropteroate synthase
MSGTRSLALDGPRLLAIVNTTPDSFYAGSRADGAAAALVLAGRAAAGGADGLDIGAESTRPGAERIEAREQIGRLLPVVRAIRGAGGRLAEIPISIDTTIPAVAEAALDAGADAINDVSGATEHGREMLDLAARRGAGIILMHRGAVPGTDRYSDQYETPPRYADVVTEVRAFLGARAEAALAAGVSGESIMLDPGLGFGKTVEQNLELVRRTGELLTLGYPVLSAASRKSFVGRVSLPDRPQSEPSERLAGSLAFSIAHLAAGARVFRVHDVAEQAQALAASWALGTRGDRGD